MKVDSKVDQRGLDLVSPSFSSLSFTGSRNTATNRMARTPLPRKTHRCTSVIPGSPLFHPSPSPQTASHRVSGDKLLLITHVAGLQLTCGLNSLEAYHSGSALPSPTEGEHAFKEKSLKIDDERKVEFCVSQKRRTEIYPFIKHPEGPGRCVLSAGRPWRGMCFEGQLSEDIRGPGTFHCICTLNHANRLSGGRGRKKQNKNLKVFISP